MPLEPRLALLGAVTAAEPLVESDDVQVNGDNKANPTDQFGSGEGLPANETSIAVNPLDPNIVAAAANDYEPAVDGVQGIYMSFDGGHTWPYSRHARQVVTPDRRMLGSGDPVVAWDSAGVVYAVVHLVRARRLRLVCGGDPLGRQRGDVDVPDGRRFGGHAGAGR